MADKFRATQQGSRHPNAVLPVLEDVHVASEKAWISPRSNLFFITGNSMLRNALVHSSSDAEETPWYRAIEVLLRFPSPVELDATYSVLHNALVHSSSGVEGALPHRAVEAFLRLPFSIVTEAMPPHRLINETEADTSPTVSLTGGVGVGWRPFIGRPSRGATAPLFAMLSRGSSSIGQDPIAVPYPNAEAMTEALINALEDEPIEDGERHPAEAMIEQALRQDSEAAANAIQSLFNMNVDQYPLLSAAVLRCLGRLPLSLVSPWGMWTARSALVLPSVIIREAAVRALEMWGGEDAVDALRARYPIEPVPWLAEYMRQVMEDLAG